MVVDSRRTSEDLGSLTRRLAEAAPYNIGYPTATDLDLSELVPLLTRSLNNVGDPFDEGIGVTHTKSHEREVLSVVAELLRAPEGWWGYITSGSSEGTLHSLMVARQRFPDALVFSSRAAHYSVSKAAWLLGMPMVPIRASDSGEIDYTDLEEQVSRHRDRPVVIVANIGATMTEAIDDLRIITAVLDRQLITRRFVHADAALAGIPLALLKPHERPGFDFADGADTVIFSSHKFFADPSPGGVLIHRSNVRDALTARVPYIGAPDTTIAGSRSGHTALVLWHVLRTLGLDGLRRRAETSRALAQYATHRLEAIGWPAWRNPLGFTVVLQAPTTALARPWVLPSQDGWSHIICMPGVTRDRIDLLVDDLEAALATSPARSSPRRLRLPVLTAASS